MTRVDGFRYKDIVSFKSAYSQVTGVESTIKPGIYSTLSMTVIEGFNVLDMVTADRIMLRITSRNDTVNEPEILFTGSGFENLRIAGKPVEAELDVETFAELDTYSKFRDRYLADHGFRCEMRRRMGLDELDQIPERRHRMKTYLSRFAGVDGECVFREGRPFRCSLIKNLTCGGSEIPTLGNVIEIPEFGVIRLAETAVGGEVRSLNMLNITLGCAYEGELTTGEGSSNGRPWP